MYGEDPPLAGNASKLGCATFAKLDARARDEIRDRTRDQDFAGGCLGRDPRADVNGDPADFSLQHFALTGVESHS